jgi:predicted dehydrogenase
MNELYAQADAAPELVILASPISLHAEQTIRALENGSNVLCEKPLCSTTAQARQMIAARDRAGRIASIGYQWSFSDAIQHLKRDIAAGRFGRPKRLRTLVLWPRDRLYYSRNNWVGRQLDPVTGAPVYDSPVNNACAHFLHNMLYVLGAQTDRSASPQTVTAELYRANDIENYDTAAIRCITADDVELLFYVSHATESPAGPLLSYEFENAVIRCTGDGPIVAQMADGTRLDYGTPSSSVDLSKLWKTAAAIRDGTPVECGIEASMAQTQVMCAAQRSAPSIIQFPQELSRWVSTATSRRIYVEGLGQSLRDCFDSGKLPAELGFDWARASNDSSVLDCPDAA